MLLYLYVHRFRIEFIFSDESKMLLRKSVLRVGEGLLNGNRVQNGVGQSNLKFCPIFVAFTIEWRVAGCWCDEEILSFHFNSATSRAHTVHTLCTHCARRIQSHATPSSLPSLRKVD